MYKLHTRCRACDNPISLTPVADFGVTPLANDFHRVDEPCAGYAPLKLMVCEDCMLPQLSVVVNPQLLYNNYPYIHSASHTLDTHLDWLTTVIRKHSPTGIGSVLEIGSNDGYFLSRLKATAGVTKVQGVEPAIRLAELAETRGIETTPCLFGRDMAQNLDRFDVVVARHVFAHIDDWMDTMAGIESATHTESLVVIEVQYGMELLRQVEWDQIYHEHLSYVTLTGLAALLRRTNFHLHDVAVAPLHGGSLVAVLRDNNSQDLAMPTVLEAIQGEKARVADWIDFAGKATVAINSLRKTVDTLLYKGKTVAGYGAPAKATNWISACHFTSDDLAFVTDTTPFKIGRLIPGSDISIVDPAHIDSFKPNYLIMFPWNFEEEIVVKEQAFLKAGGNFIVPRLPIRFVI